MKIAIASDHAGFDLKEKLKAYLGEEGHDVVDVGPENYEPGDDYPKFAAPAAEMVARGDADRGIVICDSGIGVDIVANKVPGIRSALVHDEELAKLTREHNDSNVLALGTIFVDEEKAKRIADNWLNTDFSGAERHTRRINQIADIEKEQALMLSEYEMDEDGE